MKFIKLNDHRLNADRILYYLPDPEDHLAVIQVTLDNGQVIKKQFPTEANRDAALLKLDRFFEKYDSPTFLSIQ